MKQYEYIRFVFPKYSHLDLFSTDPELIKWLLEELKKIAPSCHILGQGKDLSGNVVHIEIDKLSNKDLQINTWLLQELCHQGWEPFAVNGDEHGNVRYIHLRLEKSI